MKMNKNTFKLLPPFKTYEEEATYWNEHSFEDYDKAYGEKYGYLKPEGGYKWVKVYEPTDMIHVRLPVSMKKKIEKEANKLKLSVSATMRMWTAERLEKHASAI